MFSSRTPSYTEQLDKLRNDLHRDVVQTAGLKDITFEGFYEFVTPIETYVTYYSNDRNLKSAYIKVVGVSWDGNLIAEDEKGQDQHIRYNQLSLENLSDILIKLKSEEMFLRRELHC
jgi:hypothetical protein